jgi:hypothetical protein
MWMRIAGHSEVVHRVEDGGMVVAEHPWRLANV